MPRREHRDADNIRRDEELKQREELLKRREELEGSLKETRDELTFVRKRLACSLQLREVLKSGQRWDNNTITKFRIKEFQVERELWR